MATSWRGRSWRRYSLKGVPIYTFGRLPEEEQLVVIPFLMRTLRMAGLGESSYGLLHPEDEEVTEIRLR